MRYLLGDDAPETKAGAPNSGGYAMSKTCRSLAAAITALGLIAASGSVLAAPKDKPDTEQEKVKGQGKAKQAKNKSGKALLGDKIKKNGSQKLEDNGKFTASADVESGKVKGVSVKHADKGEVPVTKYKTTKQMASRSAEGIHLAQYGYDTVVTLWIGFAYIDDWGYEVIYWFPVDLVIDGDYGAVEYYDYYGY
jgi:hypothetical protein